MTNRTYALCVALTVEDEGGDTPAVPLLLSAEITVDALGEVGTITFHNVLTVALDYVLQDAIRALRFETALVDTAASAPDAAHFDWVISVAIDADGQVRSEKLLSAGALQLPDRVPDWNGLPAQRRGLYAV